MNIKVQNYIVPNKSVEKYFWCMQSNIVIIFFWGQSEFKYVFWTIYALININ